MLIKKNKYNVGLDPFCTGFSNSLEPQSQVCYVNLFPLEHHFFVKSGCQNVHLKKEISRIFFFIIEELLLGFEHGTSLFRRLKTQYVRF
jgi:hypothetical protein